MSDATPANSPRKRARFAEPPNGILNKTTKYTQSISNKLVLTGAVVSLPPAIYNLAQFHFDKYFKTLKKVFDRYEIEENARVK